MQPGAAERPTHHGKAAARNEDVEALPKAVEPGFFVRFYRGWMAFLNAMLPLAWLALAIALLVIVVLVWNRLRAEMKLDRLTEAEGRIFGEVEKLDAKVGEARSVVDGLNKKKDALQSSVEGAQTYLKEIRESQGRQEKELADNLDSAQKDFKTRFLREDDVGGALASKVATPLTQYAERLRRIEELLREGFAHRQVAIVVVNCRDLRAAWLNEPLKTLQLQASLRAPNDFAYFEQTSTLKRIAPRDGSPRYPTVSADAQVPQQLSLDEHQIWGQDLPVGARAHVIFVSTIDSKPPGPNGFTKRQYIDAILLKPLKGKLFAKDELEHEGLWLQFVRAHQGMLITLELLPNQWPHDVVDSLQRLIFGPSPREK